MVWSPPRRSPPPGLRYVWSGLRPLLQVSAKAIANLKNWQSQQRFKKIALTAIATQLNEGEIKGLKDTFQLLDANGDGSLTLDEVKNGCEKHSVTLPEGFEEIFRQLDSDGSGQIDYTEFIAATMDEVGTYSISEAMSSSY